MRRAIGVFLLLLISLPASASVQNVKISGGINSSFIHRANFDAGVNSAGDEVQDIFVTQTKLKVDATLTDNVDAVVAMINERTWNVPANDDLDDDGNTEINIHEAYVVLREMIYSPLTIKIGRQKLAYGNSFIIGDGNGSTSSGLWNVARDISEQKRLDAIRMIFDYNPLTIDMFYAKYDANNTNLVANDRDDVDYYGFNASYDFEDRMHSMIEGYFFARYDRSKGADVANDQNDTVYCPGFRISTHPMKGMNLQLEYAHQSGTHSSTTDSNQQKRDADAVQLVAMYQVPAFKEYKPVLLYAYTRLSGDNDITAVDDGRGGNLSGETYQAWDPMLYSQGVGTIAYSVLRKKSSQYHVLSLQTNPLEDVMTKFQYIGIWLDNATHTGDVAATSVLTMQPDGSSPGIVATIDEKHVGNEFDWITTWNYTEDVSIGANLGIFLPGKVFNGNNKNALTQAIINVSIDF